MPIIGTRSAWAMALAVARPTRRPVNRPGPMSTATTLISLSSIWACAQVNSMAGVSVSAWRLPRLLSNSASTPSCPPTAQLIWWVADSMPRISIANRPVRRWPAASATPTTGPPGAA